MLKSGLRYKKKVLKLVFIRNILKITQFSKINY